MPKKKEIRSHCPISYALDVFGDKWTLLIIRDLLLFGKRTYGEFAGSEEKIATNILADRLAALEEEGIVSKAVDNDRKSRFIYSITQKGIDLLPIMVEIIRWSSTYDADTHVPKEMAEKAKKERDAFLREILQGLANNQYLLARQ